MPGAGGIIATNHLYNIAAQDGTVIGMVNRNMPHVALTKMANVQFDPAKFNWLGSPEVSHSVCVALTGVPVQKAEDLFKHELLIGGAGSGSAPSITSHLLVQPARHEAQAGRGLQERARRVARHDAQGGARRLPVAQRPAGRQPRGMDRGRQAQGAVQPRTEAAARASRASATIFEYAKTDEQRAILDAQRFDLDHGPADADPARTCPPTGSRRCARRSSRRSTIPNCKAEVEKVGGEVTLVTGEEMQKAVAEIMATPPEIAAKTQKMIQSR